MFLFLFFDVKFRSRNEKKENIMLSPYIYISYLSPAIGEGLEHIRKRTFDEK